MGGAEELRRGPGAAVRAWRRLCRRVDVYTPQDLRACGQGDRLPRSDRRLPARAGECPSWPGQRYGPELQMAARSGDPARPCRIDRRLGRRRPCGDDDLTRPPAGFAVAGCDDAAVALARYGSNRRYVRDERAEGPDRLPRHDSGDGRDVSWREWQP